MGQDFLKRYGVYQIYPISFCDSNGDGKGDIQGIISKIPYIKSLGVRCIWISPLYKSPMRDMGYDISDYKEINPIFGTMDDFDELIKVCKENSIRVVMDLVVNHTSCDHPWFKEALADPESKYRNYYIFRKGKDGNPPNNWTSSFTGSAWEKVEGEEDTYYLHLYSKEQPDLNFHNEDVIKEVEEIMAFWMDKGVYGFRCDVISEIYKTSFEDGKGGGLADPVGMEHYIAQEGCHQILKRLRKEVVDPRGGVLIGECYGVDVDRAEAFLDNELDTLFGFEIAHPPILSNRMKPKDFKRILVSWQEKVSCNGNYLENHDQHRSVGKYVKAGSYEKEGSKMLLTLLCSLKGIPFFFQAQELGAKDYESFNVKESNDVVCQFLVNTLKKMHVPMFLVRKLARKFGRDDARGPMPFNPNPGYGFTTCKEGPWQKFYEWSSYDNVEIEEKNFSSVLNYFKKVLKVRQTDDVLCFGDFKVVETRKDILAFIREYNGEKRLCVFNLSDKVRKVEGNILEIGQEVIISNKMNAKGKVLVPYECRIIKL